MKLNNNNTTFPAIQKFIIRYKIFNLVPTPNWDLFAPKQSFDSRIFNIHKKS